MSGIRIAHIINPVKVEPDRDLYFQQPITFESMKKAVDFSGTNIDLYAINYDEDEGIAPYYFKDLRNLDRSILSLGEWNVPRKLPLMKDIINALYEVSDADIFIQTNADIGVMPYFYETVTSIFKTGRKAFCINKRIIDERMGLKDVADLPLMYCAMGEPHNGHDCFVFAREFYPKFDLGDVCLGAPWTEGTFIASMVNAFSEFMVFKNAHLTFHIGDRRDWLNEEQMDYRIHCCNEFTKVLREFSKNNPKILEHKTIKYLLGKLKQEVNLYNDERYSDDTRSFAN